MTGYDNHYGLESWDFTFVKIYIYSVVLHDIYVKIGQQIKQTFNQLIFASLLLYYKLVFISMPRV